MLSVRVAIVGGGLAGLYAAALLEARGVTDYVLLEARETFGGRIMSVPVAAEPDAQRDAAERFDLGATWFWPAMQPELLRVVTAFGVEAFEQYETGAMLVERARDQPAMRIDAGASMSGAWRMAGGMGALTDAISRRLDAARLRAGWRVQRLRKVDEGVDVEAEDGVGRARCWRAAQVLLAMPPRLAVRTVAFAPALPDVLALPWAACQTWMAPHAKYLAVYDMPFWREQGLSGGARSAAGPLAEIHDASGQQGGAALFGFLGVPAAARGRMAQADLRAACRAQLVRLFGERARWPRAEFLKDWADDVCTAVDADRCAQGSHAELPPALADAGAWKDRLIGIASEWSPAFGGYAAGAVDAARRGVEALLGSPDAGVPARRHQGRLWEAWR
ncbi:protoporphyrinogen oxidase [Bordetella pertussis]|uniref:Amine oxidase domain-containing protein n=8 Tax=Bordetella pertussis TaxID=520 RepID=Q7VVP3_BORPE|nr:FAD-dependent oxidoreductase [Bordetella pertussis]ETH42534.1 NAD(P)-binding Rossmann-like domain protein [Bordetella pertussis H939]ETH46370.1 NAD(P)-binding Rossmann-like domain protein [Bordetella pertussis H921]ETH69965.1 NAD(P)-binding Rossmann-like domain protein [Bordetella pertussis STO1-CHLA-0011]ETI00040.1 NAD(P)-binding Rossmann-like domain protein [Bordetella pertussis STO1-CHOM-0012]KCV17022.1 NAD(P)-binding Rossmann-like domain protein [Bordetella pertussis B200]KCV29365.1 NA